MAENTAFSSSGEDVITRTLDVSLDNTTRNLSPAEFDVYYDIEDTANWIREGGYVKVALQFPDELLHDSVPIYQRLQTLAGNSELYILADTSYGSCCVDEVAAEHVNANAMVHYGHACMSQTYRLPVMYVFGRKPLDVDACIASVTRTLPPDIKDLTLRLDVAYSHLAGSITTKLKAHLSVPLTYKPLTRRYANHESDPHKKPSSDAVPSTILYIGHESLGLSNLLITHSSSAVYVYDPLHQATQLESIRTNKMLMRRYAAVQRARDADVFGIVVGTLGVASYLPLIKHLRALLKKARKKSYTISVGRLNPAKLANFMEVECFVLIACPENSLIDAKDFMRPIVTPFELEVALQVDPDWTGKYVLDFEELLAMAQVKTPELQKEKSGDEEEDEDRPVFSLVSGKYRQAKQYGGEHPIPASETASSQALVTRDSEGALTRLPGSAAGAFLNERSYRGLEPRFGQDAPGVLEQGRTGRAAEYDDDH
ncbi:diphthamide biosynthesis protein [Cylindrobasidium torrendii FP15055 ss-10]|uniref:2-(3-amino-3-carboxypropyl)histidine synthase subunit 2 n=1 Tax=Cylindrobasidium torrendii FP15055 ss-10 TaxID=1314674 RepID=A0A0D7BHF5_9AGAR|nr:diphthamide biosynthesis protein [Cylindrobasidium torrendii FP15055 ss-10]